MIILTGLEDSLIDKTSTDEIIKRIKYEPISFKDSLSLFNNKTKEEALLAYSIFNGIPHYLKKYNYIQSIKEYNYSSPIKEC